MAESIKLSYSSIIFSFMVGNVLSLIYLGLLWYSIKLLPRIKKKGLFLFSSAILRLFLFLFLAIYLSQHHVGKFLWIIIGFITARLIFLSCFKNKRRIK